MHGFYRQAREERGALERRVTELERRESPEAGDKAGALVQRFWMRLVTTGSFW